MARLGRPQRIILNEFEDCLKRTRKRSPVEKSIDLIELMLKESSILDYDTDRAYHRVAGAIQLINKKLCPGIWCTRTHCKHYSTRRAYSCKVTEPSRCKIYKKYIEDKAKREASKKENEVNNE